jgi:hypothetical protein
LLGITWGTEGPSFEMTAGPTCVAIVALLMAFNVEACEWSGVWIQVAAFNGMITGLGVGYSTMSWWRRRNFAYSASDQVEYCTDVQTSEVTGEPFVIEEEEETRLNTTPF